VTLLSRKLNVIAVWGASVAASKRRTRPVRDLSRVALFVTATERGCWMPPFKTSSLVKLAVSTIWTLPSASSAT
jgi:hypothetical protein